MLVSRVLCFNMFQLCCASWVDQSTTNIQLVCPAAISHFIETRVELFVPRGAAKHITTHSHTLQACEAQAKPAKKSGHEKFFSNIFIALHCNMHALERNIKKKFAERRLTDSFIAKKSTCVLKFTAVLSTLYHQISTTWRQSCGENWDKETPLWWFPHHHHPGRQKYLEALPDQCPGPAHHDK